MLIPFPTFEAYLAQILEIVEDLDNHNYVTAEDRLRRLEAKLICVRSCDRHRQLSEFIGHACRACRRRGFDGAISILLTAVEVLSTDWSRSGSSGVNPLHTSR